MLRYICFVYTESSSPQQRTVSDFERRLADGHSGWRTVLDRPGAKVLCHGEESASSRAHGLTGAEGVILGTLFRRTSPSDFTSRPCIGPIGTHESSIIAATKGRHLVENYWGSYVALLVDPTDQATTWFLKGPTSRLGCLTTSSRGVRIHFSHMSDCLTLGDVTLSVSWGYIARRLTRTVHRNETGFVEVNAIDHGECLQIKGNNLCRHWYWRPVEIARSRTISDEIQATRHMHESVRSCIHAHAANFDSIMMRLSGGLDSAIVLGCLRDAPTRPRIIAVNRYSCGKANDEREYARAAAKHVGCELIEISRDPYFRLEDILTADMTESPRHYLGIVGQKITEQVLARERGCEAMFSGDGGDELFYKSETRLAAADCVWHHGIGARAFSSVTNAAHIQLHSVGRVVAFALANGLAKRRWEPRRAAQTINPLLNWDTVNALIGSPAENYFWYDRKAYVPPGKQFQISGVVYPPGGGGAFDKASDPISVAPLLSQPVIETCLQIPTYILSNSGWDRAIARRAFENEVPREILRRRSKGGQEDFTSTVFRKNLSFVRQLLLDGYLARERIVNKTHIEAVLSDKPSNVLRGMNKLTGLLNLETWLTLCATRGITINSSLCNVATSIQPAEV